MKTVNIICSFCGAKIAKPEKEIKRQQRKNKTSFYCSIRCAKKASKVFVDKQTVCEYCSTVFISKRKHGKYGRFCSKKCASLGSVTSERKLAAYTSGIKNCANLKHELTTLAVTLRNREWWKYIELDKELHFRGLNYQFEFPFENYPSDEFTKQGIIVDLVLFDKKCIFEFDGREHRSDKYQHEYDMKRDNFLRSMGYSVHRISIDSNNLPIPFNTISEITGALDKKI